jgi:hypothetical protein
MAREHYGSEYSRTEDPSHMVLALELTKEEVLERLKKILKGVSVIPYTVPEYHADNSPLVVSYFSSTSTLFFIFPLLLVLSVFISLASLVVVVVVVVFVVYLQDLGQNFVDPIPVDDNPSRVKAVETLLEHLQLVSLKPPPSFLVLPSQKSSPTLNMSLV